MTNLAKSLLALLAVAAVVAVGGAAAASTIVVTPTNQQGWSTADTRPGGAVNFIVDATAPSGAGALQLTTDLTTAAKAQYMHATSTPLADVTELSYYTKQNSAPFPEADPSYQLGTCLGGIVAGSCVGFTTFVYEPYENGVVVPQIWQQWDVASGQVWSSKTYTDGGTCTVVAGAGGAPFYSLALLKTLCPNAVVVSFGVNVGSFNPGYDVETDLVDFNGTTYDFEPSITPSSKDDCKNGGYTRFNDPAFQNQGECVSYVTHHSSN